MLKKTVVVHALALAFGGTALVLGVASPAFAQSNATGTVSGRVEGTPGASIALTNVETGLRRTATVDAAGRYQATSLPPGHYRVDLLQNGNVVRSTEVDVLLAQGVDASFTNVQEVQVTGRRSRIDLTTAANGVTFTAKELNKLPVQQNLTSIVLLAPNTTRGDPAFGNTASFGGSGVSENAFYLNGFPITNPLSQLGSMELPFGAIQQANVLTGGFGAEFGRSIGGVLAVTSKSGTNTWEAGATYSIEPNAWRANRRNIIYPNNGAETDGQIDLRRDNRSTTTRQYGGYVGGPIIRDKLFMFIAADQTLGTDSYVGSASSAAPSTIAESGWNANRTWENRWLGKLDWNITDNHRLEFTSAGDDYRGRYQKYGYVLDDKTVNNGIVNLNGHPNNTLYSSAVATNMGPTDAYYPQPPGSKLNSLRYNGQITDDLTVTALYGVLKSERGTVYEQAGQNTGGTVPPSVSVINYTGGNGRWPALDPNLFRTHNIFPGNRATPGEDETKAARFDIEYKIGDHKLRAGIDSVKIDVSGAGVATSGGMSWSYRWVGAGNANTSVPLSFSRPAIVANYGGSGLAGYYVRSNIFSSITDASAKQNAQYLEDQWQVSKNVLLTLGVRNDTYSNSNGDGEKFIDMKSQVAPRFSAIWDVNGDQSLKVYGSLGRYYLQLPTSVAARAASRSTYLNQDFTYTGVDPNTGAPLGLVPINTQQSPDGEYNQRKDPRAIVADGLKPNYQDELTIGFDKAWSPDLNFGGRVTYRKLGAGIDDSCDTRPILDFAQKNGIPILAPDAVNCYIYNPGRDVTLWVDGNDAAGNPVVTGKGQYAHFTTAQIAEPKAKRTYAALDVYLEHPMRNGWFGRVNYTLSRSKGNMEGQTRSDTGQTDVGTSAAWDFPEFAPGSDGLLPNDRKHQLKALGAYQITPELTVGGFATIQSGRPRLCLGTNNLSDGSDDNGNGLDPSFPYNVAYGGPGYSAEYYYCGGKPAPRGSLGRLPWEKRLDLNLVYAPNMLKGLAVKVDVFNVFNSQRPITQDPTYDEGDENVLAATYNQYTAYQAARSIKLTVEYNKRF
ncbi:TonB-dependent receptor [Massilia sp. YIM B02763]|uniref:TonB-dependent receptor n=1 Tax=Massilia sp. YIM B02763 TaxID=3050130 RepID=UPI0025B6B676|nr:TonB-dependent receptor [Massilia sp. YIM B02763]MDN4052945.1 TonB-dependent receptor [Massilia sp. YIM B02763]